jgi:hypothetical protein
MFFLTIVLQIPKNNDSYRSCIPADGQSKRITFDKGCLQNGGIKVGALEAKMAELEQLYL